MSERAVVATVAISSMLIPLNSTMIAVALPELIDDLRLNVSAAGWLVTAYLIAMASLQPVTGRLGDRVGRRRLVIAGLAAFGAASLGAALSTGFAALAFFRVAQACAGAVVMPNGTGLVRQVVPARRLGGSMGMVGSTIAFGAAIGPPLGGLLAGAAGWRSIFWVNVPVVAAALILAVRSLPADARPTGVRERFDLRGAFLLCTLLATAALVLKAGAVTPWALAGTALFAIGGFVFVRIESAHAAPAVNLSFFKRGQFRAAIGAVALTTLALYSLLVAVPLMLSGRPGWTANRIGFAITALSAAMVVLSPIGGRLSDRFGRRKPAVAGTLVMTVALVMLAVAGVDVGTALLLGVLAASGVGIGLSSSAIHTAAVESVELKDAGAAAGLFSTGRYAGSITGTSILAGLLTDGGGGFGAVFIVVAAASAAAVLLSAGLPGADASNGRRVEQPAASSV